MKNIIVGLTGQTGAGKSTISHYLSENGVTVIDADQVAREVVDTGSACIADIALEFGCEYINMDGTLNRKKMAKTVFTDKTKLKKLNGLMFPYIIESMMEKLEQLRQEKDGIIVMDAPTLFESGADRECDCVISVTADKDTRLERIIQRDGLTEEEAEERISAQHDEEYYRSRSWQVLENNGDLESLKHQADERFVVAGSGCRFGGGRFRCSGAGNREYLSADVSPKIPAVCGTVQPGVWGGQGFGLCGSAHRKQL